MGHHGLRFVVFGCGLAVGLSGEVFANEESFPQPFFALENGDLSLSF
jgi:hypothetical protein